MAQTYTVKKGDELNKIASQFGVDANSITGYKSGDPNLIYEGEQLSIPDKATDTSGTTGTTTGSSTSTYADEMKKQLSGDGSSNPLDVYGVDTLRTNLKDTQSKKDQAYKDLEGAQTKLFNDSYATSGLSAKKEKIATLDQELADLKSKRDDLIAGIRGNSNLSVSQMSGDIKKSADYYTNQINNKIAERNGVATEYNNGLSEIEKQVARSLADKKLAYDKLAGDETNTSKKITEYVNALKAALVEKGKNDRYDKQLANALEIARLRRTGTGNAKLTPIKDFTGAITGWYDNSGNQYDANANLITPDGGDTTPSPAAIDSEPNPFANSDTTPAYEGDGNTGDPTFLQRLLQLIGVGQ